MIDTTNELPERLREHFSTHFEIREIEEQFFFATSETQLWEEPTAQIFSYLQSISAHI